MTEDTVHRNSSGTAGPPRLAIAVIGAGPVGLALALRAAAALPDAEVSLFDARPGGKDVSGDPRTLALSLGSVQALGRLGAWDPGVAQPILEVHVSQQAPSLAALLPGPLADPALSIRASDEGVPQLGAVLAYGAIVAPLQRAWEAAVARQPGRLFARWGTPVAAMRDVPGGVEIDGRIVERFDLAVVAEGGVFQRQTEGGVADQRPAEAAPSASPGAGPSAGLHGAAGASTGLEAAAGALRDGVPAGSAPTPTATVTGPSRPETATLPPPPRIDAGVATTRRREPLRHDYRQTAWVGTATFDPATPIGATAYERFTRHGPAALLPLRDGRAGLVWCVPSDDDPVAGLDDVQRATVLRSVFHARTPRLASVSPLKRFPLGLVAERSLVSGRTVRIGNAAQTLHPVAGQGLNLGLRDAEVLVRALAERPGRVDIDRALARLERERRSDRWSMIATTDFLARSFTWKLPGAAAARGVGIAALDALGPLMSRIARLMMFGTR
jgi:2-octaprenyl-6-methoxyphenol hydroxylase